VRSADIRKPVSVDRVLATVHSAVSLNQNLQQLKIKQIQEQDFFGIPSVREALTPLN
jgi:hypothetical protein